MLNLIGFPASSISQNLYRASRDGFRNSIFQSKCGGFNGTLTIIKSANSFVFGGFTTALWNQTNYNFVSDPNAFIFSLINNINSSVRLNTTNSGNSIYEYTGSGPIFGSGNDLNIGDQSNILGNSYSNLGATYQLPSSYTYNTQSAQSFLAGSYWFQTTEIEVYSINCK